ncbi:MAG: hypothetical protein ACI86H_000654 [bacterium]|jgi:hypothetical protein
MKSTLFLFGIFFFLFSSNSWATEKGSFLLIKSAYLYENSNLKGRGIFTRKKIAYPVLDVLQGEKAGRLVFRVTNTNQKISINGSGYILEDEGKLKAMAEESVKVYPTLPAEKIDLIKFLPISATQVTFTGKVIQIPNFPYLKWREINYNSQQSKKYWVSGRVGIYRPDKGATWFSKVYQKLTKKKFKGSLKRKILMGLVERGYTEEQVRLTLGNPVKELLFEDRGEAEWSFTNKKVLFKNKVVHQIL